MIFVFLSSREKALDTNEFNCQNSKHCRESQFLARKVEPCINLIIFSIFLIYVLFSKTLSGGNTVWSNIFIHKFQCVSQMK